MNRRQLLAIGSGSVLVGANGCLEGLPQSENESANRDGPEAEDEPEERNFPEHPGELNADEVTQFVTEYEETYHYNEHLGSDRYDGASCRTEFAYEGEEAIYTSSGCNYDRVTGENFAWDDAGLVLYAVTPNDVKRVTSATSSHEETYEAASGTTGGTSPYGIWFGNFSDREHDITVRIRHQTDDGNVVVLDETWDRIGARHVQQVTAVDGTYELHVELANGTTLTETVAVPNDNPRVSTSPEQDGSGNVLAAVIITPAGDIVTRDLEFVNLT